VSSKDVDFFRVKIHNPFSGHAFYVGFQAYRAGIGSGPDITNKDWYNDDGIQQPASYYLGIPRGTLHGKSRASSTYDTLHETWSTIEFAYDREAHTISFNVDDRGHRVAFTNVREPDLRAMCSFHRNGQSATFF
jgi:hypothetical protein